MQTSVQLRVFATPLIVLAITSMALSLVMQFSGHRYYMYMMFAGIVCAHIDLAIAWLIFGGGSYWVRMPLIVLLTLATCWLMSYTFPQKADVWLGMLLVRIPCVGLPLLISRFRGAHLVHVSDPASKKRGSLQYSLTSLLTLFTTTTVLTFAGRFAAFPREALPNLIVFTLTSAISLAAMAAGWSHHHTALKMLAVLFGAALFCVLPGPLGPGYDVMSMMVGALTVSVMTLVLVLRLLGYRIEYSSRPDELPRSPAMPKEPRTT